MKTIKIFRKLSLGFACRLVMLTVLLLVEGASVGMYAWVRPWAKYADGTLTFYYGEKSSLGTGEYELNTGYNTPGWYTDHKTDITKVVFDESFKDARPTSCYYWFAYCDNIEKFENLQYLNTSEVTNMEYMFYHNKKITELDVSHFDTRNVTNMIGMLCYIPNVTKLDVSHFDTQNVTNMRAMFYNTGCSQLDVSNFNTSKVKNMKQMFAWCRKLKSINFGDNFSTVNVETMDRMFDHCYSLKSIDLSSFNTGNVANMYSMFEKCYGLEAIYASDKFTTDKVTSSNNMFLDCKSLSGDIECDGKNVVDKTYAKIDGGYFRDKAYANRPWAKYADGTLTFFISEYKKTIDGSNGEYELNIGSNYPGWITDHKTDITKVVFDESFKIARPTTGSNWFFCENLVTIENISYLNTSEMTDMSDMFYNCKKLQSLDVSNFNTAKVNYMNGMFYNCRKLQSLDVSNFNTAKVENIRYMFDGCEKLQSLNVSNFNTAKVEYMKSMFFSCYNLQSLDLSNFNTENVTTMEDMFYNCGNLQSLDLSNFNTAKVTDMSNMFRVCGNLKAIYVSDKFTTYEVKYSMYMYNQCPAKLYTTMADYMARTDNKTIKGNVIKPYFPINAKAEYGTLCSPVGGTLGEGTFYGFDKLYEVDADKTDDTKVVMKEVTEIEAGKPYVYRRNLTDKDPVANAIVFNIDETAASAPQNPGMLKGTFESMIVPGGSYILQTDGMFHRVNDSNATLRVGAYRAYLDLSSLGSEAKAISMSFDDFETTGIREVNTADSSDTPIYDLTGRRINKPQRGQIYIQNGKKRVANF